MWKWSGNAESDGLSKTRRTGNKVDVNEEERRFHVDDEKSEDITEQGWRSIN